MSTQSLRKDFLHALGGGTGIYIFGTAMGFLVGVQLARGLGVAGYGLYGSAMAAASLGATVAAGGVQLHATRGVAAYLAKDDHGNARQLVRWSIKNVVVIGCLAAIAVGGYVLLGQGAQALVAFSAMVLTFLMALLWLIAAIIRGTGAVVLGQALDGAIRPAAQAALLFVAVLAVGTMEVELAIALSCAAIVLALSVGWQSISRVARHNQIRSTTEVERSSWRRASMVMGMTTVIRATEAASPLILIGMLSTTDEAGFFRVAAAAVVFSMLGTTMISGIVPQSSSRLYATGEIQRLRSLVSASCLVMVLPPVLLLPIMWVYGEIAISAVFGREFSESWRPLTILMLSSLVVSFGGMGTTLLHISGHEKIVTVTSIAGLITSITFCLILVPHYGAIGAAASVLAGSFIGTASRTIAARIWVGIDPSFFSAILNINEYLAKR